MNLKEERHMLYVVLAIIFFPILLLYDCMKKNK